MRSLSKSEIDQLPQELFSRMEGYYSGLGLDWQNGNPADFAGPDPIDGLPPINHPYLSERFKSEIDARTSAAEAAAAREAEQIRRDCQDTLAEKQLTWDDAKAMANTLAVSPTDLMAGHLRRRMIAKAYIDGRELTEAELQKPFEIARQYQQGDAIQEFKKKLSETPMTPIAVAWLKSMAMDSENPLSIAAFEHLTTHCCISLPAAPPTPELI